MAQQNVPTPAFTEFEIPAIRSELKAAMACKHCDDSSEVHFWLNAVEEWDDKKLLECYKTFGFLKNCCVLLLLVLNKKQADTEILNITFAKLAVTLFAIKLI